MNSNAYVRARLVGHRFYGSDWKNITVEETFHTLGMILKMSLVNIRLGGLKAYFNPIKKLYISYDDVITLKTIETNWTDERLMYKRFLRIRAAIHPEDRVRILVTNAINSELQYSSSMITQRSHSFLDENFPSTRVVWQASRVTILFGNTMQAKQISVVSTSVCW